jgi:hypothetical protein
VGPLYYPRKYKVRPCYHLPEDKVGPCYHLLDDKTGPCYSPPKGKVGPLYYPRKDRVRPCCHTPEDKVGPCYHLLEDNPQRICYHYTGTKEENRLLLLSMRRQDWTMLPPTKLQDTGEKNYTMLQQYCSNMSTVLIPLSAIAHNSENCHPLKPWMSYLIDLG